MSALDELDRIEEGLLLNFQHRHEDGSLYVTVESWDKGPGADRRFVEFCFSGVSELERVVGPFVEARSVGSSYAIGDVSGAFVVEAVRRQHRGDRYWCELCFGSLGNLRVAFAGLRCTPLDLVASREGDDWVYTTLATGRRVVFADPFGRGISPPDAR